MYTLLPNFHVPKPAVQVKKPVAFGAGKPEKQYIGTEETRKFISRIIDYLAQQHGSWPVMINRRKDEPVPPNYTRYFKAFAATGSAPFKLGIMVPVMEIFGESGDYHCIGQDGSIAYSDDGSYKPGTAFRTSLEKHFADLIAAIREGRTEPGLPKWLASDEAPEKFTPQNLGKAWGAYIPPEHLSDINLQAVEKTLNALRALAETTPRAPNVWERHYALPGVELPGYISIPTRLAGDFATAAETLKTSLCALGDIDRDTVVSLCETVAKKLAGSKAESEEIVIKPSLQAPLQAAIELNNKYTPHIEAYKARMAEKAAEAQAKQ